MIFKFSGVAFGSNEYYEVPRLEFFSRIFSPPLRTELQRANRRAEAPYFCDINGQCYYLSFTRCCATGIIARTFLMRAGSMRALTVPMPSEAIATTWPQGSATNEWP